MDDVAFADAKLEAPAVLDRDWLAVVASAVGLMLSVGSLTIYTFGVFVGPLATEFKWSRTELFGAVAISQYALALSVPFWGYLIDRLGPRSALVPSVVIISLLFASLAFLTPNLWHLYLIFALFPLLAGGASPLGYSAVIVRKFEGKLGQALGLALMGVGLGAAIPSFFHANPDWCIRLAGSIRFHGIADLSDHVTSCADRHAGRRAPDIWPNRRRHAAGSGDDPDACVRADVHSVCVDGNH
jgi:MFS family permease